MNLFISFHASTNFLLKDRLICMSAAATGIITVFFFFLSLFFIFVGVLYASTIAKNIVWAHPCLSAMFLSQNYAAVYQWSCEQHVLPCNNSRMADQIFIKFCMEVVLLDFLQLVIPM